jgi:8-oxo-dGTP diphosphatase
MSEGLKRPIVIVAACALLNREGAVLIAKRPAGRPLAGLWEFPGGKVEAGEKPEER